MTALCQERSDGGNHGKIALIDVTKSNGTVSKRRCLRRPKAIQRASRNRAEDPPLVHAGLFAGGASTSSPTSDLSVRALGAVGSNDPLPPSPAFSCDVQV